MAKKYWIYFDSPSPLILLLLTIPTMNLCCCTFHPHFPLQSLPNHWTVPLAAIQEPSIWSSFHLCAHVQHMFKNRPSNKSGGQVFKQLPSSKRLDIFMCFIFEPITDSSVQPKERKLFLNSKVMNSSYWDWWPYTMWRIFTGCKSHYFNGNYFWVALNRIGLLLWFWLSPSRMLLLLSFFCKGQSVLAFTVLGPSLVRTSDPKYMGTPKEGKF